MESENKALQVKFNSDAGDDLTVKDYFKELLKVLWAEKEGFSGKRPFGNSGWEYDLYAPLIKNGFIKGSLDADGYIQEFDEDEADNYIYKLIDASFCND